MKDDVTNDLTLVLIVVVDKFSFAAVNQRERNS